MIVADEVRQSLAGAWGLLLNRPEALRRFDLTVEGFWRSFGAIILVAPVFIVAALAERDRMLSAPDGQPVAGAPAYIFERLVALGVDWIALPIVLFLGARMLGIERGYPAFIIARNWSAVIATLPFGLVSLLYLAGVLGDEISAVLFLAALALVLRYNFVVARTALGASIGFAAGLVAFDFVLSLLIAQGIGQLFAA